MRKARLPLSMMTAGLALTLSACGGGDGGSTPAPTPVPTPSPTPSPTPAPTPTATPTSFYPLPGVFGALGQTASQEFVALAIRDRANQNGWDFAVDPTSYELGQLVRIRLDSSAGLIVTLPGRAETAVGSRTSWGNAPDGRLIAEGYPVLGGQLTLSTPWSQALGYAKVSGEGGFVSAPEGTGDYPLDHVAFVYGVATPPSAVPASGIARYRTSLAFAQDIVIDFATGKVSGSIAIANGARNFVFTDVVLTADRTGFKGTLTDSGSGTTGVIEGRLTGVGGEEIIGVTRLQHPTGPIVFLLTGARQ